MDTIRLAYLLFDIFNSNEFSSSKLLERLSFLFSEFQEKETLEKIKKAIEENNISKLESILTSLDFHLKQELLNWAKEEEGKIFIDENIKQVNRLKRDLQRLLEKLKKRYLLSDDFRYLEILPYQENKRDINDIYINLKSYWLEIKIEDLISTSTRDGKTRALIYGREGIGNTTLSKYFSYRWAKGKLLDEFDLVIYLPLRNWEGDSLKENILKYYFPVERENLDIAIEDIKKRKTLFIFDGYDELKEEYKRDFRNILRDINNYIITSKQYGFYQGEFNVNETFENIGFTDENVEEYIRKYFKNNEERANRLIERIKDNESTYQMAHIPLMLELICSISKEEEQDFSDLTITELYKKVVDNIFKWYSNKKEEISEEIEKILNILGKLAFEGLKRQKIVFDKKFIKEVLIAEEIELLRSKDISSRFLKTDKKSEELLDNNIEFIHLTFQEYLSAHYVSNLDKEEIREIIKEYKFYPHMQVFFMFLAGLTDDKNFLIKEVRSEPRDVLGFYEVLFLMSLLSQIKPEELDKKLFEEFKKDLFKWLKFTAREGIQYEKLLENLPLIKEYAKIDDKIVNKILGFINDENIDSWIREGVAKALAKLERKDDWFVNKLIDFINDDKIDKDIRGCVAEALENIRRNDDWFVNKLIDIINDENMDWWIKEKVAEALENIGRKDDWFVNKLIDFINDDKIDKDIRGRVAEALENVGRNDDWFVNKLIDFINDDKIDKDIRGRVAEALENIGRNDDWFVNKLIDFINDDKIDKDIRGRVAEALKNIRRGDDWFVNKLIDIINNENIDWWIREGVAKALGKLGRNDDWFINKLVDIINDENIDSWIREGVAEALGNIGRKDDWFVNKLIDFINDDKIDWWIKKGVAKALRKLGRNDDWFINKLVDIINDENIDSWIREGVAEALGSIKRKDNLVIINALIDFINNKNIDGWVKGEVAIVLANIGRNDDLVVNTIVDFINNDNIDECVKEDTVEALGSLGREDDWFVNKLIDVIKNENIDWWIRKGVAELLGNIGRNDDWFINKLIDFINDDKIDKDIRGYLARSLGNIRKKDDWFIYKLIDIINNENIDWWIREGVAEALAKNLTLDKYKYLKIANKYFEDEFVQYTNTEVVIKAFKENIVSLDFVFLHGTHKILPFYLKENNKLHTIFEGKELKSKSLNQSKINKTLRKFELADHSKWNLKDILKFIGFKLY